MQMPVMSVDANKFFFASHFPKIVGKFHIGLLVARRNFRYYAGQFIWTFDFEVETGEPLVAYIRPMLSDRAGFRLEH
jgi:hypothetical protein